MTIGNENDFKYVLQDFSNVYIGMRMTYKELAEADDTPQKLKTAIYQYMQSEMEQGIRLCDHMVFISEKSQSYMIYQQLRGKFKVMFPETVTDRKGNSRIEYREQICTIADLVKDVQLRDKISPEYILEFRCSKLRLGSLPV